MYPLVMTLIHKVVNDSHGNSMHSIERARTFYPNGDVAFSPFKSITTYQRTGWLVSLSDGKNHAMFQVPHPRMVKLLSCEGAACAACAAYNLALLGTSRVRFVDDV